MKNPQEKLLLLKSVEALNNGDEQGFYLNMLQFLAISDLLDALKPQTLWEPEKVHTVMDLLLKTESISGDVVELGVFRGGGTVMIAEMLKRLSSKRRIIGIDSFEGLPEETEHDVMKNGNVLYSKGKFKNESSYDYTMLATKAFRVERYASYVKGFFSEIFPQLKIDSQFSLVIIDPDQYKGTMESLDTFYKYVTPGGYFLIDDYNSCAAVGVKKAVDEFLEDKPESIQNGGLTMGYFQKK